MKKIGKEMGEQCISKVVVGMVLRIIQNVPKQGGSTLGSLCVTDTEQHARRNNPNDSLEA